ncbi:hypothetical protein PU345_002113 [Enterobacter kobei]|nr:hypothetical protein [Enterobacter kobei]
MREQEFKHVIALMLEDAKRLLQLEPNAGTEARIWMAKKALAYCDETERHGFVEGGSPVTGLQLSCRFAR